MDHAFTTAGASGYEQAMRVYLGNRPATTRVTGAHTVEGFIDHLETAAGVTRPVDNLIIASHGNDNGWLEIDLDVEPRGVTRVSHTDADELVAAETSGSVAVPAALTNPGATFFIRGCKVGQDARFLELFRTALGGGLPVNAPRFFHYAYFFGGIGAYELFLYDFQIVRLDPFARRADVLAAFDAGGMTRTDGSAVPTAAWNDWVPAERQIQVERLEVDTTVPLGQEIGGRRTLTIRRGYRHEVERFPYVIDVTGTIPAAEAARKTMLRDSLANNPDFQALAPYPVHERFDRLGATSARRDPCTDTDDFVDSFTWDFRPGRRNRLHCTGTRHVYTVAPPVTDPATGALRCNFLPDAGAAPPAHRPIADTDATFFVTVP
jgi:hypothetical protein